MTTTPYNLGTYNFGTHTRYFPRGESDFTIDALHGETGQVIKVVSPDKICEKFGLKNYQLDNAPERVPHAVTVKNGIIRRLHLETLQYGINRVVCGLKNLYPDALEKVVTRGALDANCKTIQVVSLPTVYKILFGVELNQEQKLDLGIVVRNAIPEVKNRPKVLTLNTDTKETMWILHYTLADLPTIVQAMLSIHNL
jgi:hypothetical protein